MTGWQLVGEITFWLMIAGLVVYVLGVGWSLMLSEFQVPGVHRVPGASLASGEGSASGADELPAPDATGLRSCAGCECDEFNACEPDAFFVNSAWCSVCDFEWRSAEVIRIDGGVL